MSQSSGATSLCARCGGRGTYMVALYPRGGGPFLDPGGCVAANRIIQRFCECPEGRALKDLQSRMDSPDYVNPFASLSIDVSKEEVG